MGGGEAELTVTSAQSEGPGSIQGQGGSWLMVTVEEAPQENLAVPLVLYVVRI